MFELREEVLVFLQAYNADSALLVADEIWHGKLTYQADNFNLLNRLNLTLLRKDSNILLGQNSRIHQETRNMENQNK